MSFASRQPTVSVIVPLFNEAARVGGLVRLLTTQTYPAERLEIILVDNGSTDDTLARCQAVQGPNVQVAHEPHVRGPDAARNRGLEIARGEILAFTDADCAPEPTWIAAGVEALAAQRVDLVGGTVDFVFTRARQVAELYDAVSFLRHDVSIPARQIAFTANLFVRRTVFDALGPFPVGQGWTGDSVFTAQATAAGFRLGFAPAARISHIARRTSEVVTKVRRIGYGRGTLRRQATGGPYGRSSPLKKATGMPHVTNLWPPSLASSLRVKGIELSVLEGIRLWCFTLVMLAVGGIAYLRAKETRA